MDGKNQKGDPFSLFWTIENEELSIFSGEGESQSQTNGRAVSSEDPGGEASDKEEGMDDGDGVGHTSPKRTSRQMSELFNSERKSKGGNIFGAQKNRHRPEGCVVSRQEDCQDYVEIRENIWQDNILNGGVITNADMINKPMGGEQLPLDDGSSECSKRPKNIFTRPIHTRHWLNPQAAVDLIPDVEPAVDILCRPKYTETIEEEGNFNAAPIVPFMHNKCLDDYKAPIPFTSAEEVHRESCHVPSHDYKPTSDQFISPDDTYTEITETTEPKGGSGDEETSSEIGGVASVLDTTNTFGHGETIASDGYGGGTREQSVEGIEKTVKPFSSYNEGYPKHNHTPMQSPSPSDDKSYNDEVFTNDILNIDIIEKIESVNKDNGDSISIGGEINETPSGAENRYDYNGANDIHIPPFPSPTSGTSITLKGAVSKSPRDLDVRATSNGRDTYNSGLQRTEKVQDGYLATQRQGQGVGQLGWTTAGVGRGVLGLGTRGGTNINSSFERFKINTKIAPNVSKFINQVEVMLSKADGPLNINTITLGTSGMNVVQFDTVKSPGPSAVETKALATLVEAPPVQNNKQESPAGLQVNETERQPTPQVSEPPPEKKSPTATKTVGSEATKETKENRNYISCTLEDIDTVPIPQSYSLDSAEKPMASFKHAGLGSGGSHVTENDSVMATLITVAINLFFVLTDIVFRAVRVVTSARLPRNSRFIIGLTSWLLFVFKLSREGGPGIIKMRELCLTRAMYVFITVDSLFVKPLKLPPLRKVSISPTPQSSAPCATALTSAPATSATLAGGGSHCKLTNTVSTLCQEQTMHTFEARGKQAQSFNFKRDVWSFLTSVPIWRRLTSSELVRRKLLNPLKSRIKRFGKNHKIRFLYQGRDKLNSTFSYLTAVPTAVFPSFSSNGPRCSLESILPYPLPSFSIPPFFITMSFFKTFAPSFRQILIQHPEPLVVSPMGDVVISGDIPASAPSGALVFDSYVPPITYNEAVLLDRLLCLDEAFSFEQITVTQASSKLFFSSNYEFMFTTYNRQSGIIDLDRGLYAPDIPLFSHIFEGPMKFKYFSMSLGRDISLCYSPNDILDVLCTYGIANRVAALGSFVPIRLSVIAEAIYSLRLVTTRRQLIEENELKSEVVCLPHKFLCYQLAHIAQELCTQRGISAPELEVAFFNKNNQILATATKIEEIPESTSYILFKEPGDAV